MMSIPSAPVLPVATYLSLPPPRDTMSAPLPSRTVSALAPPVNVVVAAAEMNWPAMVPLFMTSPTMCKVVRHRVVAAGETYRTVDGAGILHRVIADALCGRRWRHQSRQ